MPLRPAYPRKRPLTVGALIPTGAAAADGIEVRHGATLAVEEINATGGVAGRRVELVTSDVDLFDLRSVERGRLFIDASGAALKLERAGEKLLPALDAADDALLHGVPHGGEALPDVRLLLFEVLPEIQAAVFAER